MKHCKYLILLLLFFSACKYNKDNAIEEPIDYSKENLNITTTIFPENISKVFEAHGGIDNWNNMQSLAFTIEKPNGDEVTLTNLKSREALIKMPKHTIGFDGKNIWLAKKDTTSYKGNPKFYYNLMFYFYAMPFILADDGIVYSNTKPLVFNGVNYPGIKIGYENGIGESPEDEYILYYNPETFEMEWLGYTVTYFSKEKSQEFHFIKYSDWQTVSNLKLPKVLTWYNYKNNMPTKKRNDLVFKDIKLAKTPFSSTVFNMPDSANVLD